MIGDVKEQPGHDRCRNEGQNLGSAKKVVKERQNMIQTKITENQVNEPQKNKKKLR